MFRLYNKRFEINPNTDCLKVFHKFTEMKNNFNFDNLVPKMEINEKELTERIVVNFNTMLKDEIKFKPNVDTLSSLVEKEKPKVVAPAQQAPPPAAKEDPNEPVLMELGKLGLGLQGGKKLDEGIIVMNLAIPKNLVNNKQTSRSMTRRSVANIMNKDKRDSVASPEIPEALQAVFNLPFLIPQAAQETKTKSKANDVKMTLKIGSKVIRETQEHIDQLADWLDGDQLEFLKVNGIKNLEISRVNDDCNLRQTIMKKAFAEIPFKKRYNLVLSANR